MSLRKYIFLFPLVVATIGLLFLKLKFFIYITNWALVLHLASFICLRMSETITGTKRRLFITSWCLGWLVTLMFWLYIFPILEYDKLPPTWHYLSTHGGIHIFFVYEFLQRSIDIYGRDFIWPILVTFLYFFVIALPLKLAGITIYPLLFDEVIPTLLILGGAFVVLRLSFLTAYHLQNKKAKRV